MSFFTFLKWFWPEFWPQIFPKCSWNGTYLLELCQYYLEYLRNLWWILSRICEKPFIFFLHLFHRNSKTSQKSIAFSFFYHFVTQILVQKAHTFSFFVFSWICPEQSLIKPIEIAVFVLKMTYFGYENGQLWTMPISNLEMFFKILVNILTNFHKLFSFMKNH